MKEQVKPLRRKYPIMDYKWEQFGDEIKQSVQDAVERGDFSRLNQTVNDSVSRAADAISPMVAGIQIQK